MWCWNCGERVDWDDLFCPECDADLTDEGGESYDDENNYTDDEEHY
jgi:hypothetical protein